MHLGTLGFHLLFTAAVVWLPHLEGSWPQRSPGGVYTDSPFTPTPDKRNCISLETTWSRHQGDGGLMSAEL